MNKAVSLFFLPLVFVLCCAYTSQAAPTVIASPAGGGKFVLQGSALQGVATMDITVTYDATSMSNPKVVQGSLITGAMMAVNKKTPGSIRLGIMSTSTINGSGPVATISFDVKGGAGNIVSIKASFSDINGKPLDVLASVEKEAGKVPPEEPATVSPAGESGTATPPQAETAGGSTTPTYLGDVTMPKEDASPEKKAETAPEKRELPPEEISTPVEPGTPASPAAKPEAEEVKPATGSIAAKGVLARFMEFKGEKSPKNLIALFAPEETGKFVQEPEIALSDGKTVVKITVEVAQNGKNSPNFVFSGASLKSLKMGNRNAWVIVALPKKGTYDASLRVLVDGKILEFPLTVAPLAGVDLDGKGGVTEADFNVFLKERGTEKAPKYDLNSDRKRDYVDDYIFTANYILKLKEKEMKKGADKKK